MNVFYSTSNSSVYEKLKGCLMFLNVKKKYWKKMNQFFLSRQKKSCVVGINSSSVKYNRSYFYLSSK